MANIHLEGKLCTVEILTDDKGKAPSEIMLTPWGDVKCTKGDYIVNEESAQSIIALFESKPLKLPLDYEHQTLDKGPAPAAGWIQKIISNPGKGIFAEVTWNTKAREMIEAGEYRYLSPVIFVDKETRVAKGIHSAALTNKPAVHNMQELIAASAKHIEQEINNMPDNMNNSATTEAPTTKAPSPQPETQEQEADKSPMSQVKAALDVNPDAELATVLEMIAKLKSNQKPAGADATMPPAEIVTQANKFEVIAAHAGFDEGADIETIKKHLGDKFAVKGQLEHEVKILKDRLIESDTKDVIQEAKTKKKIVDGDTKMIELLTLTCKNEGVEAARGLIDALPPRQVPTGKTEEPKGDGGNPQEEWDTLVAKEMEENKVPRRKAVQVVAEKNPELQQRIVASANHKS